MSWKEVQASRKQGDLRGAKERAYQLLKDDPKDFRTRSELEWSIYFEVKAAFQKAHEAVKEDKRPQQGDLRRINNALSEFTQIPPERPGMACSVLLGQLCRVAPEYSRFAAFVDWVSRDGLRSEDWQPNTFDGGQYPPLVVQVARALSKWVKVRADATQKRLEQTWCWLEMARPVATGDDAIWLNWDSAGVLRRLGRHAEAAEKLSSVIKAKRNEFWVWADAGRLYIEDNPDLALACFCRALECPADAEFVTKTHRELAELLAERREYAQASVEIAAAAAARTEQGWGLGRELEALMRESWYEPEPKDAENAKRYYAKHSGEALILCFDTVETRAANYLGLLTPSPSTSKQDRKPRPRARFALLSDDGKSLCLVGPNLRKPTWRLGQPLSLVIGKQHGQQHETIVQVEPRAEGEAWDCTLQGAGVVVGEASEKKLMQVFAGKEIGEIKADRTYLPTTPIKLGQGVQFRLTQDSKNGRWEAFAVRSGPLPDEDIKEVYGRLKRVQKGGFAFVDDVLVPPPVLKTVAENAVKVAGTAIYAWSPKNEGYRWRIIRLIPTP